MLFVTSHAFKKSSIAGIFVTDSTFKYDQLAILPNTKKSTYIQICVFSFKSDRNILSWIQVMLPRRKEIFVPKRYITLFLSEFIVQMN